MGLFRFLFGEKRPAKTAVSPDQVWLTEEAKFTGISQELSARSQSETDAILLVAHFPDVLTRLQDISGNHEGGLPVRVVLARDLTSEVSSGLDERGMLDLIIGERHPLRSVDDQLELFIRELPCRSRVCYHISIDDPVIRAFAGANFKDLLRSMGMKEGEAIQSSMITRQIQKAQQRLDRKAFDHVDADSAGDWLQRNCPSLMEGKM